MQVRQFGHEAIFRLCLFGDLHLRRCMVMYFLYLLRIVDRDLSCGSVERCYQVLSLVEDPRPLDFSLICFMNLYGIGDMAPGHTSTNNTEHSDDTEHKNQKNEVKGNPEIADHCHAEEHEKAHNELTRAIIEDLDVIVCGDFIG